MVDVLLIVSFGFLLGVRHAADADHVVAVTTIVARQQELSASALTGLLWGLGHSLTVFLAGAIMILFKVTIPPPVGLGMELSVGAMLVALGVVNVAASLNPPERDGAVALDRRLGRLPIYGVVRPVVIGVVHGLAGSAAVTLLVVGAVSDPRWAVASLVVFGAGTVAGMMLVTVSLASAARVAKPSRDTHRRFGLVTGIASVIFGLAFAYQVWT